MADEQQYAFYRGASLFRIPPKDESSIQDAITSKQKFVIERLKQHLRKKKSDGEEKRYHSFIQKRGYVISWLQKTSTKGVAIVSGVFLLSVQYSDERGEKFLILCQHTVPPGEWALSLSGNIELGFAQSVLDKYPELRPMPGVDVTEQPHTSSVSEDLVKELLTMLNQALTQI